MITNFIVLKFKIIEIDSKTMKMTQKTKKFSLNFKF